MSPPCFFFRGDCAARLGGFALYDVMPRALIALGSNLGERRKLLEAAVQRLATAPGVQRVRASSWHETKAIGGPPGQSPYLNGAALVETSSVARSLAGGVGTDRTGFRPHVALERWQARTIDLDLLLFDEVVLHTPNLNAAASAHGDATVCAGAGCRNCRRRWCIPKLVGPSRNCFDHLQTALPYVAISSAGLPETQQDAARQLAVAIANKAGWRVLEFAGIPPFDSPSLTRTTAIEFLRQQAELLVRTTWSPPSRTRSARFGSRI